MKPITISVATLIYENKILLIKRVKSPYIGYWSLPGGKIEVNEHISQAAKREILEETGIKTDFIELKGVFSEIIKEKENHIGTFLVFVNILKPHNNDYIESNEGELKWFDLNKLNEQKEIIIESDYLIIKEMIINNNGKYYEVDMEKTEGKEEYKIKRFEKIN